MRKNILLFLILFSLFSCNRNKSQINNTIYADIDDNKPISIFQFFKSIELIPLETKNESLIADISTIQQNDSILYILDRKQEIILLFNTQGKFVNKINRKGRGPGEYTHIYDMKLNPYNQTLEVLNAMGQLHIFSLNGEYIESLKLPYPPTAYYEFSIINKDSILFYTLQEKKSLHLFSRKENKIINDYYEENRAFISYTPVKSLFQYKETTYFCRGLSDVVYKFSGDSLIPEYRWDLGKYRFDPHKFISSKKDKDIETFLKESASLPYKFFYNFQNNKYLFACLRKGKQIINIFFNKEKQQTTIFNRTSEGIMFIPNIFTDSIALAKIEPRFKIEDFIKKDMLDSENKTILSNITEGSNPILIKYHFK